MGRSPEFNIQDAIQDILAGPAASLDPAQAKKDDLLETLHPTPRNHPSTSAGEHMNTPQMFSKDIPGYTRSNGSNKDNCWFRTLLQGRKPQQKLHPQIYIF